MRTDFMALTASGGMTSSDVGDVNRRTVVAAVLRQRPSATRASISRATGLTTTTVSGVVSGLVESGLIDEVRGESAGGKPPTDLLWNDSAQQIAAIDISRSSGALTDLRGRIVEQRVWLGGHGRGREAQRRLADRAAELVDVASTPVLGVGIAIPGVVRPDGVVAESVALDWHNEVVVEPLEQRLGLPVHVINDTQSCALGEYWTSTPPRAGSFAAVRIGEGVGTGLVLAGQLFCGSAGELGHLVFRPDGERCGCGNIGCVETVLAEPRLVERLVAADPSLAAAAATSPGELFTHAGAGAVGNERLAAVVTDIGHELGAAVAPLIALLDIELISIVGAVSNLGPILLDAAIDSARRHALPELARRVDIQYSELGEVDALVGSAGAVFHSAFGTL